MIYIFHVPIKCFLCHVGWLFIQFIAHNCDISDRVPWVLVDHLDIQGHQEWRYPRFAVLLPAIPFNILFRHSSY